MKKELRNAVLRRANFRCAWCARKLGGSGVVCRLDASENDNCVVAACNDCETELARWRLWGSWSVAVAVRWLGPAVGTQSAPFVDYLIDRTGDPFAFYAAIGRVEAQRNAALDLERERAVH